MGEVFAITVGIGTVLKAIGSTGIYLKGASSASREVGDIAKRLETTGSVLEAIKKTVETYPPSTIFYNIWEVPAEKVVGNIETTIRELNGKLPLPGTNGKLSNFERAKWPLAREETVLLLDHLQAYTELLSIVLRSLMQYVFMVHVYFIELISCRGSTLSVQDAAKDVEDIITRVGTLPSSKIQRTLPAQRNNFEMPVLPEESASQIADASSDVSNESATQDIVPLRRSRSPE